MNDHDERRYVLLTLDKEIIARNITLESFIVDNGLTEGEERKVRALRIGSEMKWGQDYILRRQV
jgi:hypothetical protein